MTHNLRNSTPAAACALTFALMLALALSNPARASSSDPDSRAIPRPLGMDTPGENPHRWQYSIGVKATLQDVGAPMRDARLRPMLGLRYGRWRLGADTGENWLRHTGFIKEPNVEYEWFDTARMRVGLSARIQNLEEHSSFDGFGGGRNTLRARAYLTYRLTPRWSIDSEITQDLLLRGDGTTLSAGISYLWPVGDQHTLALSTGLGWATGSHLQTRYRELPLPVGGWEAGLATLGGGLSWRTQINPHWALFASVSTRRTLGQLSEISPSIALWGGQIGVLYFSR